MDSGGPSGGGADDCGHGRSRQERLVPRARRVPAGAGELEGGGHAGAGLAGQGRHAEIGQGGAPAHQGARAAAQGQGPVRGGGTAGALKKLSAIFDRKDEGEDE